MKGPDTLSGSIHFIVWFCDDDLMASVIFFRESGVMGHGRRALFGAGVTLRFILPLLALLAACHP